MRDYCRKVLAAFVLVFVLTSSAVADGVMQTGKTDPPPPTANGEMQTGVTEDATQTDEATSTSGSTDTTAETALNLLQNLLTLF